MSASTTPRVSQCISPVIGLRVFVSCASMVSFCTLAAAQHMTIFSLGTPSTLYFLYFAIFLGILSPILLIILMRLQTKRLDEIDKRRIEVRKDNNQLRHIISADTLQVVSDIVLFVLLAASFSLNAWIGSGILSCYNLSSGDPCDIALTLFRTSLAFCFFALLASCLLAGK
jgi:hypothetical protein